MRNKKLLFGAVFLLSVFTLLFIFAGSASAQVTETGFEKICAKGNGLAVCIQQLYLVALGLGAVVALLMIILAGYRYMTAQGNAQQVESAKEALTSAFIGLIIIFIAFILLYLINPDLVKFKGLQLPGGPSYQRTQAPIPRNVNATSVSTQMINSLALSSATVDPDTGTITDTTSSGILTMTPSPYPDVAIALQNTLENGGVDTSYLTFEQYFVNDPSLLSDSMVRLLGGARPAEIAVIAGSLYLYDAQALRDDATGQVLYDAANAVAQTEFQTAIDFTDVVLPSTDVLPDQTGFNYGNYQGSPTPPSGTGGGGTGGGGGGGGNLACSDNTDNDFDGKTDYPADTGCTDANDDSENSETCDKYLSEWSQCSAQIGQINTQSGGACINDKSLVSPSCPSATGTLCGDYLFILPWTGSSQVQYMSYNQCSTTFLKQWHVYCSYSNQVEALGCGMPYSGAQPFSGGSTCWEAVPQSQSCGFLEGCAVTPTANSGCPEY